MKIPKEAVYPWITDRAFHLILLPTEACNFRCTYCFEDFGLGRMADETVEAVKRLLTARADGLKTLTLSWYGGEPLLALDVVVEISEHVKAIVEDHPGMGYSANMTTNAYLLTPARFERLLALGVYEYLVSFDGPRDWHDRKRVLAGGRGTFDTIFANLKALREVPGDFSIIMCIHADQENLEAIPSFMEQCSRAFQGDRRFKPSLQRLCRFGGRNDADLPVIEGEEMERRYKGLNDVVRGAGLGDAGDKARSPVCYAAAANAFVVRADGRLQKCALALRHPGNDVGRLRPDGTLEVDNEAVQKWLRGIYSLDEAELGCPLQDFP